MCQKCQRGCLELLEIREEALMECPFGRDSACYGTRRSVAYITTNTRSRSEDASHV